MWPLNPAIRVRKVKSPAFSSNFSTAFPLELAEHLGRLPGCLIL